MLHRMWVSAFALTTGLVGAASAQQAEPAVSDEIIVTAQLREQRLFEVPIAVTALNNETLEQLGITKYDELALFVPGFEVQEQSANNTGFVIRGITSDSGEATTEPRVAVYQDGVSTSRNRGAYMELFDIERVEVARGPQATLYGRGALIGAVNVVQNKADVTDPYFETQLGGGEDGYVRSVVVLNAPFLNNTFALRATGALRARDGYVTNLAGGEELGGVQVAAGRVAMAFEPTSTLRFDLIGNIHNDSNSGTAFKSGTFAPIGGDVSPFTPAALNTFGGFQDGRALGLEREVRSATLLANWEISPAFSFVSITGQREFESLEVFDPDGSAYSLIVAAEDAEGDQISQEFRLSWENGGPISGFVGVSYFHEEGSQTSHTQYDERYALAFAQGLLPRDATVLTQAEFDATIAPLLISGIGLGGAQIYDALNTAHGEYSTNFGETTSYEVFADATWRATENLEITAGLRYTQDEKTSRLEAAANSPSLLGNLLRYQDLSAQIAQANLDGDAALAAELAALQAPVFAGLLPVVFSGDTSALQPFGLFTQPTATLEESGDFDALTWRLVGRYEFSPQVAGWASYARGRRPEVISLSPGNLPGGTPSSDTLPAEQVDSYEIGVRAQGLGDALDIEGSVYYYAYSDFQTTQFDGLSLVTVNAGEAAAYGFESAANWRPLENLHLFATYGYNHARFESGAREGNRFRLSPDHSASVGFRFGLPVGPGNIYVMPTYTWQSKIFFDDDNDRADLQGEPLPGLSDAGVDEFQDAYGLFNLRAGFEHESGNWSLEGFVTNALDEEYLIDAGNTGDAFTIPTFIRGAPRLVGVELTARF